MYRPFPSILDAITVVKPEAVIRWHRRGVRAYWRWETRRRGGRPRRGPRPHPTDEQGKPTVGHAGGTPRTAGARDRSGAINGGKIHDQAAGTTLSGLEDFPAQSRRWDRLHRFVCGSHRLLQAALRHGNSSNRSARSLESRSMTRNRTQKPISALRCGCSGTFHLSFRPTLLRRFRQLPPACGCQSASFLWRGSLGAHDKV